MRFLLAAGSLVLVGVRAAGPTHGVVVGDVTSARATVWSRSNKNSVMQASVYECGARVVGEESVGEAQVNSTGDFTGLVDFSGLTPETCYKVEVVFNPSFASSATTSTLTASSTSTSSSTSDSESGFATFTTAPRPEATRAVKFAWGGDISGQNVCRDADEGFPLMDVINAAGPYDFFLNVGDAIYGDGVCRAAGLGGNTQVKGDFERSADLDAYWAHWKYNLEDPGYQSLLSSQAFFMTWDDHEVVDDFGPGFDERTTPPYTEGVSLLPIGLEAFLNYNPIRATTDPSEALDFYRSVRWGKMVELFILDTRQYRSLPTDEDTAENPKTMLGATQLEWLKGALTDSTALWKLVVTSVPLSIPTGPGDDERDGWANFEGNTGYEIELKEILTYMRDGEMNNIVFITADVHFAQVLEYTPFPRYPDFNFHEIVVGPLNAGPFAEADLDDTFSPEVLFSYAPESNSLSGELTYEEFRPFFNFGLAEIDTSGNLTFSIINTDSETVYNITLTPSVDSEVPVETTAPSPAPTTAPTINRRRRPVARTTAATPAPADEILAPTHVTGAPATPRVATAPTGSTSSPISTLAPTHTVGGQAAASTDPSNSPTLSDISDGEAAGTDDSGAGAGAKPLQGFHRFFCGFSLVGVMGLSGLIGLRL